eukprot:GHVN01020817.1.p1 GENE.GHVN01020817.1~~GHVN01020817.1.p1  ORF type:complete len:650 (+),score=60.50 GHVN01020817.1:1731-3680(+)
MAKSHDTFETDVLEKDTDADDSDDDIFLTFVTEGSGQNVQIAVAYYETNKPRAISILSFDPTATSVCEVLQAVVANRRGGSVLIPSKSPLYSVLKPVTSEFCMRLLVRPVTVTLFMLKHMMYRHLKEFSYQPALNRLMALKWRNEQLPDTATSIQRRKALQNEINVEDEHLVRAAGGLLFYLHKQRVNHELESASSPMTINELRPVCLKDVMFIDKATQRAVHLFPTNAGNQRETASIFGLIANNLASSAGNQLLRAWLAQPSRNVEIIKSRQNGLAHDTSHRFHLTTAIVHLSQGRNLDLVNRLHSHLRATKDIPRLLRKFCTYKATPSDWKNIATSASAMYEISQESSALCEKVPALAELTENAPRLRDLVMKLSNVDFESSAEQGRLRVYPDTDPVLEELQEEMGKPNMKLLELITCIWDQATLGTDPEASANYFPSELPRGLWLPNLGSYVGFPRGCLRQGEDRTWIPPFRGWSYEFERDELCYFKNESLAEFDDTIQLGISKMMDAELKILEEIHESILGEENTLLQAASVVAEVDCLIALTRTAIGERWVCPQITEGTELYIQGGRHPIVEVLNKNAFIANDTHMRDVRASDEGDEGGRIQVITGPNFSGKSVYLRQVGTLVVLAQIGSFVPALEARVGLCDR